MIKLLLIPVMLFSMFQARLPEQSAPVCQILAPIRLVPPSAAPERLISVVTTVTNCSPLPKNYTIRGVELLDCGRTLIFLEDTVQLAPKEESGIEVEARSAPYNCAGPVTVLVTVFDGDKMIAKQTAVLKGVSAE